MHLSRLRVPPLVLVTVLDALIKGLRTALVGQEPRGHFHRAEVAFAATAGGTLVDAGPLG